MGVPLTGCREGAPAGPKRKRRMVGGRLFWFAMERRGFADLSHHLMRCFLRAAGK